MKSTGRVVVIGAGIGGLAAAVKLVRAGCDVTVLEAHVYPGGCAGTFFHQGYRFDAGATLAGGFYPEGPMELLAKAAGIERWPASSAEPSMAVHLPDGTQLSRWSGDQRWDEYLQVFGRESQTFWRWQEDTADALWELAIRLPPWPSQTLSDIREVWTCGFDWLVSSRVWERGKYLKVLPALLANAARPLSAHLNGSTERLRLFVDAQLLISAQAESPQANALYGAAALDLPRRSVAHLEGGMGSIAQILAQAINRHGGHVLYRQEAVRIRMERGMPVAVATRRGDEFPADLLIANLTPWNLKALLVEYVPPSLLRLPSRPDRGWGAFVAYIGLDSSIVPSGLPLHHQIVLRRPLGEGNTVFASISPEWDDTRAPKGRRALTISTHTKLEPWWGLFAHDQRVYRARQKEYTNRLLGAVEKVFPGLGEAADLVLPGTPVTFERYTRRAWGWVGGFPQVNLFQSGGPRLAPNLWLVGDSIFPGQSVAATALGGLRVADAILREEMMLDSAKSTQWEMA